MSHHDDSKNGDKRKRKKQEDARNLNRPGFWACIECFIHNPNSCKKCPNCGALPPPRQFKVIK